MQRSNKIKGLRQFFSLYLIYILMILLMSYSHETKSIVFTERDFLFNLTSNYLWQMMKIFPQVNFPQKIFFIKKIINFSTDKLESLASWKILCSERNRRVQKKWKLGSQA